MLTVKFANARGESHPAASFNELRFLGVDLWADVDAKPLATFVEHQWTTSAGRFSRIEVPGPVALKLRTGEALSKPYGPYKELSAVNGVLYVEARVFAFWDAQQKSWYAFEDGRHWRMMVVRRA
jgi:hypothetical protein